MISLEPERFFTVIVFDNIFDNSIETSIANENNNNINNMERPHMNK